MSEQPVHDPFGRPAAAADQAQPDPSDSADPSDTGDGDGAGITSGAEAALASRWARLGAWVTDTVLVSAPVYFVFDVSRPADWADDTNGPTALLASGAVALLLVVAFFVYSVVLLSRSGARNGQTVGKQIVGTRVVRKDGQPLTPGGAAKRELVRALLAVLPPFGFVDSLMIFFSEHRRTLHDMLGSTVVIDADAPAGAPVAEAPEDSAYAQPAGWYPDPGGDDDLRWWDGRAWSDATASESNGAASEPNGAASTASAVGTPGATATSAPPVAPRTAPGGPSWSPTPAAVVAAPLSSGGAPLGSRGRRFVARLVDVLIVGVPLFVVFVIAEVLLTNSDGYANSDAAATAYVIVMLVLIVVYVLYMTLMLARKGIHNGQTWGKQLLDVRVVRTTGAPLTTGDAFLREFLCVQVLGMIPFYMLADAIAAFCNERRQSLHDLMASTVVLDTSGGPKTIVFPGAAEVGATAAFAPTAAAGPGAHAAPAPAPVSTAPAQPAGWYPDPSAAGGLRWWDGSAWSDHTRSDQS